MEINTDIFFPNLLLYYRFCATRWEEDEDVSSKSIKLWPNIIKIVGYWEGLCQSKRPQNRSYERLVTHYNQKVIPVRLQFFKDTASQLKGFLQIFQTDNPMLAFLAANLESMFRTLMKMFVRREVLDEAVTGYKLVKIDLTNSSNIAPSELINLPTATKNLLKSNILSEDKKRQFKKDCITILVAIVSKLQERSPLKYLVVRCASCIAPLNMVLNKDECSVKFTKLIDKPYSCKWISSSVGDEAKKEYDVFLDTAQHEHKDAYLSFSF